MIIRDSNQGQISREENRRKHVSAYCTLIIKETRQDLEALHARANEIPVHKGLAMVWENVISTSVYEDQMKNSSKSY